MVRRSVLFFHRFEVYAVILDRSTLWRGCVVKPCGFPLALCLTALGLFRCFLFRFVRFFLGRGFPGSATAFVKPVFAKTPRNFDFVVFFSCKQLDHGTFAALFLYLFFVTRLSVHGVILGRSFLSWRCMVKRCVFPLALCLMALGLFWCFFFFFFLFFFKARSWLSYRENAWTFSFFFVFVRFSVFLPFF